MKFKCPRCGGEFQPRNFKRHRIACEREARKQRQKEERIGLARIRRTTQ